MSIILIAILLFIVGAIIMGTVYKSSTLNQLQFQESETILYKEDGVRVDCMGLGPETSVFPNCHIIITDSRFIIAQKMLMVKDHKVRYVIYWHEPTQTEYALKEGFIRFVYDPLEIAIENDKLHLKLSKAISYLDWMTIKVADPQSVMNTLKQLGRH